MARITRWIGDFARETSRVRGKVAQCDGPAALAMNRQDGDVDIAGSELLQRAGTRYALVGDQLHQQIRRHDLRHGAKTTEGVSAGLMERAGIGLTVTLHPRLIAADN